MGEDLQKQFEDARKYYQELLDNSQPMPSGTLTVDRINNLNSNNQKYIKLIQNLESFVLNSKVSKKFKKDFQELIIRNI